MRGGTDGCIISHKGLPTPNLFSGTENGHGKYEFVTLETMAKSVDVIMAIAEQSAAVNATADASVNTDHVAVTEYS